MEINIPVLPLRGLVIFPGSILHFDVARNRSVSALSEAMENEKHVFITTQKSISENEPDPDDLFKIGVYAKIIQIAKMSENYVRVVIKGISRARAINLDIHESYYSANYSLTTHFSPLTTKEAELPKVL